VGLECSGSEGSPGTAGSVLEPGGGHGGRGCGTFNVMQTVRQQWERQPKEGEAPWKAFQHYLQQKGRRSIKVTAEAFDRTYQHFRGHSRKFHWLARAKAWDEHLAAAGDAAAVDEVEALRREHIRDLAQLRRVGTKALAQLEELQDADGGKDAAPAVQGATATKMVLGAVNAERTIHDQVTERVENRQKVDLAGVSPEQARRILAILAEGGHLEGD